MSWYGHAPFLGLELGWMGHAAVCAAASWVPTRQPGPGHPLGWGSGSVPGPRAQVAGLRGACPEGPDNASSHLGLSIPSAPPRPSIQEEQPGTTLPQVQCRFDHKGPVGRKFFQITFEVRDLRSVAGQQPQKPGGHQ